MMRHVIRESFAQLLPFMQQIRSRFEQENTTIHKARNELKTIEAEGFDMVVKAFRVPNPLNRIVYAWLRDSKAKKSFDNSLRLLELGIPVPEPIGYIEFLNAGLLAQSYYLSVREPYNFTIREALRHQIDDHQQVLEAFARFTAVLHEKGVWHEDYSPGNILISREGGGYRFALVDVNRMRFGTVNVEKGCENFAKLWIKPEDMPLIARAYAAERNADETKVLGAIEAGSRALQRQKAIKSALKKGVGK